MSGGAATVLDGYNLEFLNPPSSGVTKSAEPIIALGGTSICCELNLSGNLFSAQRHCEESIVSL